MTFHVNLLSVARNHVITLPFSLQGVKKDSIRGNHPKNLMHHGNKVSVKRCKTQEIIKSSKIKQQQP